VATGAAMLHWPFAQSDTILLSMCAVAVALSVHSHL